MPVQLNKRHSAGSEVAESSGQPLASVAAVIEAYEAGKRFNAAPSAREDNANQTRETLRRVPRDREHDEIRRQQPTVEDDDDEDRVTIESARSRSVERDVRPGYESAYRPVGSKYYPDQDDHADPLAVPYLFQYDLPAHYLRVSHIDSGNDSPSTASDQLLSQPIDGVTALAINKARWAVRDVSDLCVDLEATAKRSGPADFWVHIQRSANSLATLGTVVQSSTFLSRREQTKAQSFLKKIQQDHEHETELGRILDPGALFCDNSKEDNEGVALRFFAFSRLESRKPAAQVAKQGRGHPSLPLTEIRNSRNEDDESEEIFVGNYGKQRRQHQF
jgi:hypothetical protein